MDPEGRLSAGSVVTVMTGHRCPDCLRQFPSRRGMGIHRRRAHGIPARKGEQKRHRGPIDGIPGEVDMTCWCDALTFHVPRAWVGLTAPDCDDDCYRRSLVAEPAKS